MVLTEDIEPVIGFNLWNLADYTLNDLVCVPIISNHLAATGSASILLANFGDSDWVLVGV